MKLSVLVLSISLLFVACTNKSNNAEKKVEQSNESVMETRQGTYPVDVNKSTLGWEGYKIFGHHSGVISLKEGEISFDKGNIESASFVIDMRSVRVTELMDDGEEEEEESQEEDKTDLADHLMDGDFFDAQKFPTATLRVKDAQRNGNTYTLTGELSIKDVTKEISFEANFVEDLLEAEILVDRTDFGIKYGSGSFFDNLGDNVIKDEFKVIVSLAMNK